MEQLSFFDAEERHRFWPDADLRDGLPVNVAIGVPGVGERVEWGCMAVGSMPDLSFLGCSTQFYPRWTWSRGTRRSNVSQSLERLFGSRYGRSVHPDEIYAYVYGFLHHPGFRRRFGATMFRELPRIALAPDFDAFRDAGAELMQAHLHWQLLEPHPLRPDPAGAPEDAYLLQPRGMRWSDGHSAIEVSDRMTLRGVPDCARDYSICGRCPLEWAMRYWHVATDASSGIVNDANAMFERPSDLAAALGRLIEVARCSAAIIGDLPDNWGYADDLGISGLHAAV